MRTHDTHQVLTNTDPSTIEARVAAATARVEAGLAAGTAQTGQEPTPVTSGPLSWTEVAYAALRGVVIAFALLYAISTVSGWFTPATAAPQMATETVAWTDDDFPVRVTNTPEGKRAEIAGYADITCEGCSDDQAMWIAQVQMSNAVAQALPVGEPLHVGEGDVPAYVPAILLDMGWQGHTGDGCECLYPPAGV